MYLSTVDTGGSESQEERWEQEKEEAAVLFVHGSSHGVVVQPHASILQHLEEEVAVLSQSARYYSRLFDTANEGFPRARFLCRVPPTKHPQSYPALLNYRLL